MGAVLDMLLINSLLAGVAAMFLWLVFRRLNKPSLTHLGWLFVLAKLMTPPLIAIPIVQNLFPDTPNEPKPHVTATETQAEKEWLALEAEVNTAQQADVAAPVAATMEEDSFPWQWFLGSVWLVGACLWWGLIARRVWAFRRVLRACRQVPESVERRAASVAARLGLRRLPCIYFVDVEVSPMVWAMNFHPIILLPKQLWNSLSREQQETILAHELAHIARGDHWVRRLEVLVLGVYWWLPLTYMVRHYLHQAEEACCDARVLAALPDRATEYAEALVETVAFISKPRWVPLASGVVVQTHQLERRLTMILSNRSTRRISRGWGLLAIVFGLIALPVDPGLAGEKQIKAVIQISIDPETGKYNITTSDIDVTDTKKAEKPKAAPEWMEKKPESKKEESKIFIFEANGKTMNVKGQESKALPPVGPGAGVGFSTFSLPAPQSEEIQKLKDELEILQAQLGTKEALLQAAKITIDASATQLERSRELAKAGQVPVSELSALEATVAKARAELLVKEAELNEVKVRVKQTTRKLEEAKKPKSGNTWMFNKGAMGGGGGVISGSVKVPSLFGAAPVIPDLTPTTVPLPPLSGLPATVPIPNPPKDPNTPKAPNAIQSPLRDNPKGIEVEVRMKEVTSRLEAERKASEAEQLKLKAQLKESAEQRLKLEAQLKEMQRKLEELNKPKSGSR